MNTATTSSVLKIGSQGAAVKELQTLLNQYVYSPAMGDRLVVDGIFGAKTESRVKTAQYRYLLQRDGVVGAQTWQALKTNTAPIATKPILRRGSTGVEVEIAQTVLKEGGYYKSTVDQIFGQTTEAAVRAFQHDRQLQVDGVIGLKTWKALEALATYLTID